MTIENPEVERLAGEVARLTGEDKTEAIRRSLIERHDRLRAQRDKVAPHRGKLLEYLEQKVWPHIPADQLGRTLSREEEDRILGYGPEGY